MILIFPLQAGFLVDSVPTWLAPLIVLFGVEYILVWYIEGSVNIVASEEFNHGSDNIITIPTRDYELLISGIGFGIMLSAIAVIQEFQISNIYIILLLFCGRAIEGVTAIRFYKKVSRFIRTREWGGELRAKIKHKLLILFIIVVGLYLVGFAIVHGPFFRSLGYTIQFVWSLTTLLVTAIGLRWKLRPVREEFNRKLIRGVILFVTGAELFNFALIGELIATMAGSIGYSVGFWFAAAILIRDKQEPVAMWIKNRIRDIRIWFQN